LQYQLIVEYIKKEISNGNLTSKEKLPSLRKIFQQFECSIGTVLTPYNELGKERINF
jgi:DNA-binding transcriptional MocR family regulator